MNLYAYIFIAVMLWGAANSQNFFLSLKAQENLQQPILDSLLPNSSFSSVISMEEAYSNLSEKLAEKGYFFTDFSPLEKMNDSLYLGSIFLGNKHDKIVIDTKEAPAFVKKELELSSDSITIPIEKIESFIYSLLQKLEEKGFPMSSIQLINHRIEKNTVFAQLHLSADIKRTIDNIYITPYNNFPKGIKKQLLKKYKSKVFSPTIVDNIYAEIKQFPFITSSKHPEILFTDQQTILYMYVNKANANRFDGLIGFNSDEKTGKLQFNGHLDLQLLNIFNSGEQLKIYWKNDGMQQSTLKIKSELPYLLSSPFGILGEFQIFRQDSIMQNTKTNLQALYYFSLQNRVGLGIENTSSTTDNLNTLGAENYSNTFFTINHYLNKYNNHFIFPISFASTAQIGYGNRNNENTKQKQLFAQCFLEKNWQISTRNFIHQAFELYFLKSEKYFYNELYRFGGNNSLRGIRENSLFTHALFGSYNEYRFVLSPTLYTHTISDIAYYKDPISDTKNLLFSVGLGLGIKTNGGIFNIIYAVGKQPQKDLELKNAIVHIRFKTVF